MRSPHTIGREEMEKLQYKILAVIFVVALVIFAAVTDYNYISYYVNDVVYNEKWVPDLGRKNETDYMSCFFGKEVLIDLNGGVQRLMGTPEMNEVVRLQNGHLTGMKVAIAENRLIEEADDITYLYHYLKERGIPFLYVAAPDKIAKHDKELPIGYADSTNENLDIFLEELKRQGVPYIDMRDEFFDVGMDQYDYFFLTDHHWTMEGGFYAYTKIAEWLQENAGLTIDPMLTDISNYTFTHYDNAIVGSWGQRTGKLFSGTEGIDILSPEFHTALTRTSDGAQGTYDEVLVRADIIEENHPQHIYDLVFGYSYSGFTNQETESDARILMACDSFGKVVNPFLILSVKQFDVIESYYPEHLNKEYIEGVHPDAIILMQCPANNLGVDSSYTYELNLSAE